MVHATPTYFVKIKKNIVKQSTKIERGIFFTMEGICCLSVKYIVCILIFRPTMKVNIFSPSPCFHVKGKEMKIFLLIV